MSDQITAPSAVLLEKIQALTEMHDKKLMMYKMDIVDFIKAEDKGLIQVLIALDDSAEDMKLDYQDKQIIKEMLDIVPDKMAILLNLSTSATRKAQTEAYLRQIIRTFMKKSCKQLVNRVDEAVS